MSNVKFNKNLAINELKKDLNKSVAYQRDLQQNLDETKSILIKLQEKTAKELNEIDVNFNNKILTIKTEINRTVDKMGIICQNKKSKNLTKSILKHNELKRFIFFLFVV